MADADIQGLLVRIEATTAQLRQEMARGESAVNAGARNMDQSLARVDGAFDRAGNSAQGFQQLIASTISTFGSFNLAAAGSVAGLVALTNSTINHAREVKNLSSVANSSVEEFQRMAFGAKSVGIEQGKLGDILKDVNDRVGEFLQRGGGEMADFFKEIGPKVGVTAEQFRNLSGPQALQLYYTSLEKAGLNQQQLTTYMEALGDEATALIPLLRNNGKGFKDSGDNAERLGAVISGLNIDRLVDAGQAVGELQATFSSFGQQIAVGLLPGLEQVTTSLASMRDNGGAQKIGEAISFLAENVDILVAALGGKMAAAFAKFAIDAVTSSGVATKAFLENVAATKASAIARTEETAAASASAAVKLREAVAAAGATQAVAAEAAARVVNLQAVRDSLAYQAALAAGTVEEARFRLGLAAAEAELAAAKTASTRATAAQVTASNAAATAMARDTAATQANAAATLEAAAAKGVLARAGAGLFAFLGGPAGLAALAIGVGVAFLTLRDNTSELEKRLGDLSEPMDKLVGRFEKLNRASQAVTMRELQASIAETQSKVAQMSGAMADKFESDLRAMGAAGADGLMAGLVDLPADTQAALELVRKASKDQASGVAVDWKAVADQLRTMPGVTEEMARALESSQGPVTDLSAVLDKQQQTLAALTAETDKNTEAQNRNSSSKTAASAAGQKYIEELTKQLQSAQDKTFTDKANRVIQERTDLTEGEIVAIRSLAAAQDAQKAADDAASQSAKDGASATKKAVSEEENRRKALADLTTQSELAVTSADRMADAYQEGTDKSRELTIQQKVEEALLKTGAEARAAVEAAIRGQQDAQDRLNVSKQAYELDQETADLIAQAKAQLQGAAALEAYNLQKSMTVALTGKNIEYGGKEYEQLLAANKAQQDAVKLARQAEGVGGIMDRLYPEAKLLRDYTQEQQALNAAIALGTDQTPQYEAALARLSVEYEANQRAASVWGQITEAGVERIDDAFAEMWKSVLSKSGDFMDTLKNSFRQFLAEMLHLAITKPIIVQIGSALGVGGLSGQASGILGGSSAGGGFDLQGAWNNVSGAYSVATSGFGQAVGAGWTAGEGFLGGVQGAIKAGAGSISAGIGSLFAGSSGTMVNGVYQLGSSAAPATVDLISNTVSNSATGAVTGTASGATSAAGAGLSASSALMAGIGGAIQGYLKAGVKGAVAGAGGAVAGAYAGAAIGTMVPVIGNVIGGAIGAVLGGMFGSSLFGGEWITKDTGFQLGVEGGDFQSNAFEYQKKKGGLFSSNKKRTRLTALDPEMQAALDQTYAATLGTVVGLFDSLNVQLNDGVLDGLNIAATKISTKDKTAEEIQAEIAKWFTGLGDAAVAEVNKVTGSGLEGFNLESLTTFVNNLYSVNSSFDMIGVKMVDFNVAGGRAVENLVALAGGIEALNSNITKFYDGFTSDLQKSIDTLDGVRAQFAAMGLTLPATRAAFAEAVKGLDMTSAAERQIFASMTANSEQAAAAYAILEQRQSAYYSAFFSESENTARTVSDLTAQIKTMGVTLPGTRDAFRAMVEAAAKDTSASGKALYESLMNVASLAGQAFDAIEQQAQTIRDSLMQTVNNSQSALQRAISAQQEKATAAYNARVTSLNDMSSTASKSVSDLTSISSSLSNALKALRGDSDDAVKMLQAQARATLQSALATARSGGSLVGFTGLEDALSTVSSNNTDLYGSMEDFARDQGRTANVVAELNALNGKQLTSAEKTVKALQDQLDQAKAAYDAQMAQFESQLAFAQAQIDALNGVDNSVMGVTAAINAMNAAVVAALSAISGKATAGTSTNNGTLIDSVYKSLLGRDADAAGRDYWQGQLSSGAITYDQLAQAIANAAKANGQAVMVPGYATGGLISGPGTGTSDSILARLSNGEYVMSADAVRMFGTGLLDQMNTGMVPAFATGGGVGETGPQLQITRPSQIYSSSSSAASRNGSGNTAALEAKVDTLIDVIKQVVGPIKVDSAKNQKLFSKWDEDGLPATTTASVTA